MSRVASGGELARLALALKAVLTRAETRPTLIFDEIDVGVGGRSGQVVGEKLWSLSDNHQVICITHLPQIASLAARHFAIEKDASVEPARTTVRELAKGEVVGELVRMLGADAGDVAARRHAKELLKAA